MSRFKLLIGSFALCVVLLLVKSLWIDEQPFWKMFARDDIAEPRRSVRPTSRPTTVPVTSTSGTTLLRELPRQAILITAAQEFGLPACDRSVDFAGPEQGTQLSCKTTFRFGSP